MVVAPTQLDENVSPSFVKDNTDVSTNSETHQPLIELSQQFNLNDIVIDEERLFCDLEMLMNGAFQPLKGFMTLSEYRGCLDDMTLPDGEIFPIPIVFPVEFNKLEPINADAPSAGGINRKCLIRDQTNAILASMEVTSIYRPCLKTEQLKVLKTDDANHPYVSYLNGKYGDKDIVYVGGTVTKEGPGIRHFDFLKFREDASTVRASLADVKGPVVGFQTRNPMHRAHFELTCDALRRASAETGQREATLILTPAMGPTQPGDISPDIRLRCYNSILPYYTKIYGSEGIKEPRMVILPLAMRMAGPREALWHALIRRNYGCTHFIVGRDHAGPSTKTAAGEPFYGPYEAHEYMEKYAEKIGIKPVLARMLSYVGEEHGNYLPADKIPEGVTPLNISGTRFREMIQNNEPVPEWFGFPEVVTELKSHYRTGKEMGLVLYFTGLPSSGKSTLACAVDAALRERGGERRLTTILDADVIRTHLSKGLGFSKVDRSMNVRRIGYTASEIAKHGGICLVANIAPYKEDREFNRQLIESKGGVYVEIYVDTDVSLCEERDVKGMYAKARAGIIKEFTGVNDPYEIPEEPCVKVQTNCPLEKSLDIVMAFMKDKEYI
eukprot:GHVH01003907.1.p1 GENE.GHVH01003907.1~~GHVH01003907.1.p1  ORF type:complete len:610 (-),score=86.38 GHVH01003907.1:28-1857(-)